VFLVGLAVFLLRYILFTQGETEA